jgi:hypothetical protein
MKMVEIIQTREIALCTKHQDESLTDDCLYCRIAKLEAEIRKANNEFGSAHCNLDFPLWQNIAKLKEYSRADNVKLDRVRDDFCMFWKAQGCSCCEDTEASEKYGRRLAESLNIPLFDDGSGVDYYSVCESALGDEDG